MRILRQPRTKLFSFKYSSNFLALCTLSFLFACADPQVAPPQMEVEPADVDSMSECPPELLREDGSCWTSDPMTGIPVAFFVIVGNALIVTILLLGRPHPPLFA